MFAWIWNKLRGIKEVRTAETMTTGAVHELTGWWTKFQDMRKGDGDADSRPQEER